MVIAIIGVLSAVAVPRFSSALVHRRLEASARRVVHDLTLARRTAKIKSALRTVNFYPGIDSYTLVLVQDRDFKTANTAVRLSDAPFAADLVSANFGGFQKVIFDAFGQPDYTGTIVIQVGAFQKTITVDKQTGSATASDALYVGG